jgi:hypothetical protein
MKRDFAMWNWRNAAGQLLSECRQAVDRRLLVGLRGTTAPRVDATTARAVQDLRRHGFHVVPHFLDAARCAELKRRVDAALVAYAPYVQIDAASADQRLFGLDAVDPEIKRLAFNPPALDVLTRYERSSSYSGFALTAKLVARPGNKGSGQGWHRDSAAYRQTKLMVYLTDVAAEHGPFQYVEGSHRAVDVIRCAGRYGFDVNKHRFSDAELARYLDDHRGRVRVFTAPAGTMILFDSRGIHRGMPIVAGERYAVTTYLWFDRPAPDHIRALTIEAQQARRAAVAAPRGAPVT